MAQSEAAPSERDVLSGTVGRVSYMGEAVDYQVSVNGRDVALRVTAPPPARLAAGEPVTLAVAQEACVPLAESWCKPRVRAARR